MTTSRKNEAAALWTEALMRPDQRTLLESLAADLAEYTGRPIDEVLADMASAKDRFAARWCKDDPAAKGEEAVRAFYSEDLLEAYELAFWHGGGCGEPPLNYAAAAMMLRENGASRVLDFGSGIGSGALVLAKAGLQPDIADIARPLLGYASARLQRRGINHRAIDLNTEAVPSNTYNAVCCFDVLEHVQNPFRVVNQLAQALKVGGVLLCNLPGTDDGSRPMHITAFHDRTM
ncbi:MAG: class I SAM-dependent methyltransferase, partial [Acidobacteria bacterium]|nr:class I SAM-dependent methyltransferase [Acidobacteriota bacterium]